MKKIMTGARCTIRIGEHAFLPCASFSYSAPKVSLLSRAAKQLRMALTLYGNHFEGVPGLYTLLLEPLSKRADGYMEPPELREFLLAQGFKEVKT